VGISSSATIPVVARDVDNVVTRSSAMPWFKGPSVMEALGEVEPASAGFAAARLPVQDVYRHDVPTVVGRLLSGTIAEGDALKIFPSGGAATVTAIRRFPENHAAEAGESVGLVLEGALPERGDVLAPADDPPRTAREFAGRVFWLASDPLAVGEKLSLRCGTQSVTACIEEVSEKLDTATLDPLPPAQSLASMELAFVRISTATPVVMEPFVRLPGLGRFVLERGGRPSGFGILP
jgi:bifunctional enzyme CysN/CysC